MTANNQGIVHLRIGGWSSRMLACKRTDAHMAVPAAEFVQEARQCVRCAAKWAKMKEAAARKVACLNPERKTGA